MDMPSSSIPSSHSSSMNLDRSDMGMLSGGMDGVQDNTKRRSSSRSIKRRRFDDEIVEYSLGLPGASSSNVKYPIQGGRTRTHSLSTTPIPYTHQTEPSSLPGVTIHSVGPSIETVSPTPAVMTTHPESKRTRHPAKHSSSGTSGSRSKKKGRQHNHLATKDLGRWKPMDDLALIIGLQQTNDLKTVHLGTKFSCRFTVQELQQRWYALLYDEAVSRVAVSAMRSLHPDIVAAVQDRALWSTAEEELLQTVPSNTNPNLSVFEELLARNPDVFYTSRSAKSLKQHWNTLRLYHLLPDQSLAPIPALETMNFNEAEESILDSELGDTMDETLETDIALAQRRNIKEIRQLENEIERWHVLVNSVSGANPPDFDNHTLAVLRGRLVRYLMRSREVTIGRTARGHAVDVDLSLEGPAWKISRRQATLRLRNTGEFYMSSEGKRPIFVDGKPVLTGSKARLYNQSVIEIASLRFVFSVNLDLIRIIRAEAVRLNLQP